MCEDKHTWNAARRAKIVDAFCFSLFPHVWSAITRIPNWSSMADDAITQGCIRVLGSPFYICESPLVVFTSVFSYKSLLTISSNAYFISSVGLFSVGDTCVSAGLGAGFLPKRAAAAASPLTCVASIVLALESASDPLVSGDPLLLVGYTGLPFSSVFDQVKFHHKIQTQYF